MWDRRSSYRICSCISSTCSSLAIRFLPYLWAVMSVPHFVLHLVRQLFRQLSPQFVTIRHSPQMVIQLLLRQLLLLRYPMNCCSSLFSIYNILDFFKSLNLFPFFFLLHFIFLIWIIWYLFLLFTQTLLLLFSSCPSPPFQTLYSVSSSHYGHSSYLSLSFEGN